MMRTEFRGYNSKKLSKDVLAGITVSAVALPLALAFGVSSGADAAAGLITAVLAGLVIGSLSGASFQISGPTGAMSAILVSLVAKFGLQGVFVASVLAGFVLIICGILKLGRVVSIIPMPVITGFTSGIAVIIILGQIDNFFGVHSAGETALEKLYSYSNLGFNINFSSLILGVLTVLIMALWPKKLQKVVPGSLVALILIVILNFFLNLNVQTVGEIPQSFVAENRLELSPETLNMLSELVTPALSIATLSMIESLLCGASAARMSGKPFDGDIEMIAQGVGNVFIPFFGGVPATAAIARTSVAIKSGAQTRLTSVFHAIFLILSMFLLSGVMSAIPMSVLAGILIVTAFRMNEWKGIKYMFSSKLKGASAAYLITMLVTVCFDLSTAIVIGLVFSALMFVVRSSGIEVSVEDLNIKRLGVLTDEQSKAAKSLKKDVQIFKISGAIFFGTVNTVVNQIGQQENRKIHIISMRGVPSIDSSGIQGLLELCRNGHEEGRTVLFTGIPKQVKKMMKKGGVIELIGQKHVYTSTESAILGLLS